MVFYFSGTGNSQWVAEEIAKAIGEEVADIVQLKKSGLTAYAAGIHEKVGFVFPVYAWGAPQMMCDFALATRLRENTYCFAVCTCAGEAGYTIEKFKKKIRLNSGFSLLMPNNYLLGADADDQNAADMKVQNAKIRLAMIIGSVKRQEANFDTYQGKNAFWKSNLIHFFFNKFARSTKPFYVEDSCDGCGICEQHCTGQTITMQNGKPQWGHHCTMCTSCINRCPKEAIQYGEKTKGKQRYHFVG